MPAGRPAGLQQAAQQAAQQPGPPGGGGDGDTGDGDDDGTTSDGDGDDDEEEAGFRQYYAVSSNHASNQRAFNEKSARAYLNNDVDRNVTRMEPPELLSSGCQPENLGMSGSIGVGRVGIVGFFGCGCGGVIAGGNGSSNGGMGRTGHGVRGTGDGARRRLRRQGRWRRRGGT